MPILFANGDEANSFLMLDIEGRRAWLASKDRPCDDVSLANAVRDAQALVQEK